ncbi:MAG: hypothetical protein ACLP50_14185 [Solirubrobacteraceae bacterium]
MNATTPALLAAAAGVGIGHAILPDHWAPLAVLGRTRRYPLPKVARLSGLAGVAHVLISMLLGAAVIVVGLQFRSAVQSAQSSVIGALLIATGLWFLVMELRGGGHSYGQSHDHSHGHPHDHSGDAGPHHDHGAHGHDLGGVGDAVAASVRGAGRWRGMAAVMVPFGAAASPDLTILPVFLAATTVGLATAVGSLVIFGAATIGTIVGLTVAAARGGYQIRGQWLERWGNATTGAVLVLIGMLVITGVV